MLHKTKPTYKYKIPLHFPAPPLTCAMCILHEGLLPFNPLLDLDHKALSRHNLRQVLVEGEKPPVVGLLLDLHLLAPQWFQVASRCLLHWLLRFPMCFASICEFSTREPNSPAGLCACVCSPRFNRAPRTDALSTIFQQLSFAQFGIVCVRVVHRAPCSFQALLHLEGDAVPWFLEVGKHRKHYRG